MSSGQQPPVWLSTRQPLQGHSTARHGTAWRGKARHGAAQSTQQDTAQLAYSIARLTKAAAPEHKPRLQTRGCDSQVGVRSPPVLPCGWRLGCMLDLINMTLSVSRTRFEKQGVGTAPAAGAHDSKAPWWQAGSIPANYCTDLCVSVIQPLNPCMPCPQVIHTTSLPDQQTSPPWGLLCRLGRHTLLAKIPYDVQLRANSCHYYY
jgi:hypothetical protein